MQGVLLLDSLGLPLYYNTTPAKLKRDRDWSDVTVYGIPTTRGDIPQDFLINTAALGFFASLKTEALANIERKTTHWTTMGRYVAKITLTVAASTA